MRHRLKKSSRHESVSSTKSAKGDDSKDSSHSRTPSSTNDSPRSSLTYASEAIANLKNTMGISRGPAPTSNPSASTTTATAESRPLSKAQHPPPAPAMTTTVSHSVSNSKSSSTNTNTNTAGLSRSLSTIRTVTSSDGKPHPSPIHAQYARQSFDDEGSSVGSPSIARNSNSAFSSSVNSNVSSASFASQPQSPLHASSSTNYTTGSSKSPNSRLSIRPSATASTLTTVPSASSLEIPRPGSPGLKHSSSFSKLRSAAAQFEGSSANMAGSDEPSPNDPAWDSTVGKAGLGKTGRVINRLVSDNDALKRDLKIERLKADEARQAARLLEDKMERMVSDYESRLLEASVTKTLLARKERQVESLQAAVELEKKRTADAQGRERTWRDETDALRKETKRHVEDASAHAQLMEGRYNAISSHWRSQGDVVQKAAADLRGEITELAAQRRGDDHKIGMLRELCEQQDSNIKALWEQKEAIGQQFAAYKAEQETHLADIKTNAARREAEQEATLADARQVLDKLKWALNVKSTIDWAE
ncbi:hypothetical protein F503_07039 [Ophiostoma piceae UAMH 11346]|uniref:SWI5-dependent HO expression protein 3 n=1 Tax=Ophiostoma piceae (strain UAMH 11346) TaxID=1262450 RepID=S3CRL8_OPHP1|nr:hypothetical protein F503_07039 [Ophiostoma piceae UAMH 11346]